jgi:hypothetical protein
MRNRSVRAYEVTEVGSVKRLSRPESRWEKRNVFSVILEFRTGRGVSFAK